MADVNDFGPLESADESAVLLAKLSHLELREKELVEKLKQNEAEFGQKRAMFMDLFKQKEVELKSDRDKRKELEEKLAEAKTELHDLKVAVSVSEGNKEEEIAKVRRQCKQEIETMQALLREAAEEASNSTALQYESEREKLHKLNENYEEEIQSIRSKLSQERHTDKAKSFLSSIGDIVSRGTASLGVGSTEAENLEESMRKAQQDAEILKSVVMPLEREIAALKDKLKQQEEDMMKGVQLPVGSMSQDLAPTTKTSLPSLDDMKDPEEKIHHLMSYLKTEKDARMDLEMYVAVLNTQKNAAQDEAESIRAELKEVCNILDEEKRSHDQLKQTWQMANDQFLESQRLMMMDMRRMENLLSAEQQRMLAEQQQKDLEREAQEKKVKELEEMRQRQAKEHEEQAQKDAVKKVEDSTKKLKKKDTSLHDKLLRDKSASNTSVNSCDSTCDFSFDDSSLLETRLKKSHSDLEISSISEQEFLDVHDPETRSLQDTESVTSIRISPEKVISVSSLTEAQVRAITDPTPENEVRRHLLACAKSKSDTLSMEGRRLVSDKEWLLLQEELKTAREKLGRPCDMCNNYEAQLQGVQDEFKAEQAKLRSMDRELKAEKQTIDSQKKYILELEESLKDAEENANTEICSLVTMTKECEKYLSELSQQQNTSQMELQDQLKRLIESQETAQKELTRLQNENDDLQGKHSKHAEQLQNEDINLPNNLEEMQLLLLKYREEIIAAKVDKEHTEEKLKSELNFLKDQVVSEQQEKNTMEEALTQEINSLQERLAIHDSLKSELERESSVRAESESKLREMDQSLKSQQAKSKQLINGLQKQLEEQSTARTKLEEETHKLRMKVQSLQGDLDNSEAVQRDFVKLSQSLQIQLEQIRQAGTEVRWENEEDVDDCHSCKQPFTVTKRKNDRKKTDDHARSLKHHCRHCGKIFCTDCITKSVNSGPKMRPAKVCDVCHTILVKDATPYFSTVPPSTPD